MIYVASAAASEAVWPLDAPPILTSSFGEPRSGHLHAGIDLATGGRIGVKCRAVQDGWVARMRMSPFGYGKALYIRLASGELAVYAHLDRFAEPMAQRAWNEQKKRGRYRFDIQLQPHEIPVKRGQVIAWSGDTGVGFPHLHFEMRQGDAPFNPQTAGFAAPDRITPTIRDVSVLPLDAFSHVDGEFAMGSRVDIVDEGGLVIGMGLVNYNAQEIRNMRGRQASDFAGVLGYRYVDEIIERDDLVLLERRSKESK